MKNENRIVELLADMLGKFDILNREVRSTNGEVKSLNGEVKSLNNLESEIVKLNVISAGNSRALFKLADNNERIIRLERAVFK